MRLTNLLARVEQGAGCDGAPGEGAQGEGAGRPVARLRVGDGIPRPVQHEPAAALQLSRRVRAGRRGVASRKLHRPLNDI